jgi:Mg-chelatase subunit ChlD
MKSTIFEDATESTAKTVGRSDVRVVFAGSEAMTDGRTVYLPKLPPNSEVSTEQASIMRGYRDHESVHVRGTDTSAPMLTRLASLPEFSAHVVNYCEDLRIERAGIAEYGGMRENLLALQKRCGEITMRNVEGSIGLDKLCAGDRKTQFEMVFQALGRKAYGLGTEEYDKIIAAADANVVAFAEKWVKEVQSLPLGLDRHNRINERECKLGTDESFKLGERIISAWEKEIEPLQRQLPKPPKASDAVEDAQPEQEKQPGGEPPPQGESQQQGDGQPDQECSGQADGDGKGKGKGKPSNGDKGGGEEKTDDKPEGEPSAADDDSEGGATDEADDPDADDADDADDGSSDAGDSDSGDGDQQGNPSVDGGPTPGKGGNGAGEADGSSGMQLDLAALDAALKGAVANTGDALKETVSEVLSPDGGDAKKSGADHWRPASNELDIQVDILDWSRFGGGKNPSNAHIQSLLSRGEAVYAQVSSEIKDKQAMVRRVLELELQARADRQWQSGKKSGRLDQVRLVSAIQGAENVYRKREDGRQMDTLLHITCDASGSMSNLRIRSALKLSIALADALERTGCDISIDTWGDWYPEVGTPERKRYEEIARSPGIGEFSSIGMVERVMIKEVKHRMTSKDSRSRMGLMVSTPHGGTPGWEGLFSALRYISKAKQSKKVLLFITDGAFSKGSNAAWARDANELARRANVHLIGVGIDGMSVAHIFADHVEVTGSEMYEQVMKRIAKYLAQEKTGKFKHAA